MKRLVSVGLLGLLLCHTLAYMLVFLSMSWQEERDLTNRLTVYRTVDSIVEFYVPLREKTAEPILPQQSAEGFAYRGSFYEIVRLEVHNDTLHILGLASKTRTLWKQDLLSFIDHQFISESSKSQKKANHLLKNLLKEYCPFCRSVVDLIPPQWRDNERIPSLSLFLSDRDIPVHSPPPKA
ncbi:hypothetical protein [Spirosoma endbachense]|uniref:Uncharacterized protein n=1 Tax=Spirosoma endbachense TaxID=2666025 RepID=A0A6P1W1X0_9BACT|nr:hypothetical protein [Spirosoma endbachense]QHV97980.1 hypothetical protein GJR95_24520 [Spirosoma endbachense]